MTGQQWTNPKQWGPVDDRRDAETAYPSARNGFGEVGRFAEGLLQSLSGRNPDLAEAADEVAADQAAHIFLVSRRRELTLELLGYLRRQAVTPYRGRSIQHGVWLLAALPALPVEADEGSGQEDDITEEGGPAEMAEKLLGQLGEFPPDIVLYLVQAGEAWGADDAAWVGRLRTLGAPLLPVVVDVGGAACAVEQGVVAEDRPSDARGTVTRKVRQLVGVKPAFVAIDGALAGQEENVKAPADAVALVQRIVALRPRVAVALAQDLAWCRPILARRIIRTGALLTTLVSAQPLPLLDLPFQVALQWKVAIQLATIYGRPGLDYRSREMMGTIVWNLLIRFVMQQIARFVPMMGWAISAAIGWISTTLLGHALVMIYENEDRFDLEQQGRHVLARAGAVAAPVRAGAARAADTVRGRAGALLARVGRMGRAAQTAWPRRRAAGAGETTAQDGQATQAPPPGDEAVSVIPVANLNGERVTAQGNRN